MVSGYRGRMKSIFFHLGYTWYNKGKYLLQEIIVYYEKAVTLQ